MKLSINDDCGTRILAVLKLDGTPAVEGTDFLPWAGKYHKNGKWSYSEGGVHLRNGLVVINTGSTHRAHSGLKKLFVVIDDKLDNEYNMSRQICGRMAETPERPRPYAGWQFGPVVWARVLDALVHSDVKGGLEALARWEEAEKFSPQPVESKFAAVLSTTVLPIDGMYRVETIQGCPDIAGVPHYIGHPDTKSLVEGFGAIPAPTKLFAGLQPGEQAVCFPIQQGKSSRASEGFTTPHQDVCLDDLSIRVITRVE